MAGKNTTAETAAETAKEATDQVMSARTVSGIPCDSNRVESFDDIRKDPLSANGADESDIGMCLVDIDTRKRVLFGMHLGGPTKKAVPFSILLVRMVRLRSGPSKPPTSAR